MKTKDALFENRNRVLDFTAMTFLIILCASWGLQQASIKYANQGISPLLQAGIRSAGAAVLLFLWMILRREPLMEKDGTLWWGLAAGILFASEFLLIYWGLDFTCASRSAIFFVYFTVCRCHRRPAFSSRRIHPALSDRGALLRFCGHYRRILRILDCADLSNADR